MYTNTELWLVIPMLIVADIMSATCFEMHQKYKQRDGGKEEGRIKRWRKNVLQSKQSKA